MSSRYSSKLLAVLLLLSPAFVFAAPKSDKHPLQAFPPGAEVFGRLGTAQSIQRHLARFQARLRAKHPLGGYIPIWRQRLQAHFGMDIFSTKDLGKIGLSSRSRVWFAKYQTNTHSLMQLAITHSNPRRLVAQLKKTRKPMGTFRWKVRGHVLHTLYTRHTVPPPAGAGSPISIFAGFSYAMTKTTLFVYIWEGRPNVGMLPLGRALQMWVAKQAPKNAASLHNKEHASKQNRRAILWARYRTERGNKSFGKLRITVSRATITADSSWPMATQQTKKPTLWRLTTALRPASSAFRQLWRQAIPGKLQMSFHPPSLQSAIRHNATTSFQKAIKHLLSLPKTSAKQSLMAHGKSFSGHAMWFLFDMSPSFASHVKQGDTTAAQDELRGALLIELGQLPAQQNDRKRLLAWLNTMPKWKGMHVLSHNKTTRLLAIVERNVLVLSYQEKVLHRVKQWLNKTTRTPTKPKHTNKASLCIQIKAARRMLARLRVPGKQRTLLNRWISNTQGFKQLCASFKLNQRQAHLRVVLSTD